ncbi:MAG: DUF1700 domain-containing protein [Erysipelotrichaceae bacterium]|nr:DUF1700 domain-containing protein [Erysipelotrichaceae bacterium]
MNMRKRTFLKELRFRLESCNCKDIDDVIQYYDELIEDTIERTGKDEDSVVYDLGPISEIVSRVAVGNRSSEKDYFEKDNKIHYDEYNENNYQDKAQPNAESTQTQRKTVTEYVSGLSTGVKIAIGIATLPIWLGLLLAYVGIIVGLSCASFAIGVAGIVCIIHGCTQAVLSNIIFEIGLGFVLIGVTCIVFPIVINIVKLLLKGLVWVINWLFTTCKGGNK